jgi:hypothetical protein
LGCRLVKPLWRAYGEPVGSAAVFLSVREHRVWYHLRLGITSLRKRDNPSLLWPRGGKLGAKCLRYPNIHRVWKSAARKTERCRVWGAGVIQKLSSAFTTKNCGNCCKVHRGALLGFAVQKLEKLAAAELEIHLVGRHARVVDGSERLGDGQLEPFGCHAAQ